jgi:hypothetical protein
MSESVGHGVGDDLNAARENCMRVISLPDGRPFMAVHAFLRLTEISWSQGRWQEGFISLETALDRRSKADPRTFWPCTDLVGVLFSAGLSSTARQVQVAELFRIYCRYQALPSLGEGLIRHMGKLFQKGAPFPSTDIQLSLRLLRVGIAFVQSGGRDLTVLLEVPSVERSILRQALGLAEAE